MATDSPFAFQIKELREHITHLELKIRRWEKAGINTERLEDDKEQALRTIAELEEHQRTNNREICS